MVIERLRAAVARWTRADATRGERGAFWDRRVEPANPVDGRSLKTFRRHLLPADAGPVPWLDRPDADAAIAAREESGELSPADAALCRRWARDGYVILEGFYDDRTLDESWRSYEEHIAAGKVVPPVETFHDGDTLPGRVLNAHFHVPAMDAMLREARVNRIVGLLLGARARPFQTIAGHKTSQQLAHSDSIHMTTYPQGYLAATWIAYEDVDADAGPLIYYPGSHRLPYLLSDELGMSESRGYDRYHSDYEPAIQALIRAERLTGKSFGARKGDVLIWHANLLHGGSPIRRDGLSRKALVCHYFADGCLCYHDLTGTIAHIHQDRSPARATAA